MKKWLFLLLFFLTGCGMEMTEENLSKVHFVKAEQEVGDRTPEERALIIKSRLKEVDEVVGTAVVVEGHTAIIGLRLKENTEQNTIPAVKRKVDAIVKAAGVSIDSTSITTNDYIVSMIEEMERRRGG